MSDRPMSEGILRSLGFKPNKAPVEWPAKNRRGVMAIGAGEIYGQVLARGNFICEADGTLVPFAMRIGETGLASWWAITLDDGQAFEGVLPGEVVLTKRELIEGGKVDIRGSPFPPGELTSTSQTIMGL